MTRVSTLLFCAAASVLTLVSCSSSNNSSPTGNKKPDTTPPAIASVTPIDASHVDVTFNEDVQRATAEHVENYTLVEVAMIPVSASAPTAAPGDTLRLWTASLQTDKRTVTITTVDPMSAVPYQLTVAGVADLSGNKITTPTWQYFTGVATPDVTPPMLVYRSPDAGATNVGLQPSVVFQFSEAVNSNTVFNGVSWTVDGGGDVFYDFQESDPTSYSMTPRSPLTLGTKYTITLTGVQDIAGNTMPTTSWSFTTTSTADTTPPRLVSSVPANGATNVSVNSNISLTFSEPINQIVFEGYLTPQPGNGTTIWSNGGKTLTFDPDLPLATNQQYTLVLPPGSVFDLSGNKNDDVTTIAFTTGSALESGSIAGTLSGDPNSATANDPTGAFVAATYPSPFASSGEVQIFSSAVVAANHTYDLRYLADGVYYVISVMNSNGDNELDPSTGDAIGIYNADIAHDTGSIDSLTIAGGSHITGVDFPLFDTSAITGQLDYAGAFAGGTYYLRIALFDTTAFDPTTSSPAYGTVGTWPYDATFRFNTLDNGLVDGTYYVGAYLDANGNDTYDPASDPAGLYGGSTPTPITIANGSDAIGLTITLMDPSARAAAVYDGVHVKWPEPAHLAPWLDRVSAAVRKSTQTTARR